MAGLAVDAEEKRAAGFDPALRRAAGIYFTPAPLVDSVLELALSRLPSPRSVVDPACGAGAFLFAARARMPRARLFGLELQDSSAVECAERVPSAKVLRGDFLRGGFEALTAALPRAGSELWIGNPPYNGTSPLLRDVAAYERLRARVDVGALPRGTSLRDDFAFFLLLAAERLRQREGVLAFITPSTLLDAFLYAPLRAALLESLELCDVVDLGAGVFAHARVSTCVTVWRSRGASRPRRPREQSSFRARAPGDALTRWGASTTLRPTAPVFSLRPASGEAEALDRAWRAQGEPLSSLLRVHFPGLKTRFDELLVDDDPRRLFERVQAFLGTPAQELSAFARAYDLPLALLPKLRELRADYRGPPRADRRKIRRHFRYAGAKHRGRIPASAFAYCYLDRALIPRGDHRLQGEYDPHAGATKLVFNTRELPLSAALVDEPGCVHAHRHARFAPLEVPELVWREGAAGARRATAKTLGSLVPNLSPRGLKLARELGGPRAFFERLVELINGAAVQEVWAPAFGRAVDLPVPLELSFWKPGRR